MSMTMRRMLAFVAKWYSVPLLLVLWQIAVSSGLVTSRLLPSLKLVWDAAILDVGKRLERRRTLFGVACPIRREIQ